MTAGGMPLRCSGDGLFCCCSLLSRRGVSSWQAFSKILRGWITNRLARLVFVPIAKPPSGRAAKAVAATVPLVAPSGRVTGMG